MKWRDLHRQTCPIARSAAILGDRWAILVIREVMAGVRRFDTLQGNLAISRRSLAECLDHLVQAGVLEKRLYQAAPKRYDYQLSLKGQALYPILFFLDQWGSRWLPPPADESDLQE